MAWIQHYTGVGLHLYSLKWTCLQQDVLLKNVRKELINFKIGIDVFHSPFTVREQFTGSDSAVMMKFWKSCIVVDDDGVAISEWGIMGNVCRRRHVNARSLVL